MKRKVTPYHGPCTVLSPAESRRVLQLLGDDPVDEAIAAKCRRTLSSDPRWRTPTK